MHSVLITGGGGGLGLAAAKVLGRDHRVVLAGRSVVHLDSAVKELEAAGIAAEQVTCDVTDRPAVELAIAFANNTGELRAVVHSAGVSPTMGSADFLTRVNSVGTINVTQASLAVAGDGFVLVNVASIAGHIAPRLMWPTRAFRRGLTDPDRCAKQLASLSRRLSRSQSAGIAYVFSKAFVIWYSEKMAAEFGKRGARILSVSPGSFDTEMGQKEKVNGSESLTRYSALRRFGAPEEMGALLAFCASDRSGYLTGVDILCDGGTLAGMSLRDIVSYSRTR